VWAEVELGGQWVAVDPFLVGVLRRFGGLDETRWPPSRCPGAILVALAELPWLEGAGVSPFPLYKLTYEPGEALP